MEALKPAGGLWIVLGLVLLIRLPFLNQAIQGDDDIYLTEAAHAQIDPLHPADTPYVFMGRQVDLRGHSHPPLNGWILAGLVAVFRDVSEPVFHAVYIAFSLIAAWAMWSLACRFSPQPLWATLLFVAVPAFVVNGNSLEADLPFLAFWMAAIALWCGGRWILAAVAMALAGLAAYQAVLLMPILGVYLWLFRRKYSIGGSAGETACATIVAPEVADPGGAGIQPAGPLPRTAPTLLLLLLLLAPPLAIAAWQAFEWITTGVLPARVLMGYFATYGFQRASAKLSNAAALLIQSGLIVFPALVPGAVLLAWRRRREPDTQFPLAWIAVFLAGGLVVFFAGSARYVLPMAAPFAILASRLRPRWLAIGFAAQLALGLAFAAVNYQHWDGYRRFAGQLPPAARVWVDDGWGLRYYLMRKGALPLTQTQRLRPSDIVASSELGAAVPLNAPLAPVAAMEIRSAIPLRLIGVESHSGYSTVSRGLWPFGISAGVIDRVRAVKIVERQLTLEYLPMNAPEASQQIVSGIYSLEDNRYRWMSRNAIVALKSPAAARPIRLEFRIPSNAPARRVTLVLDGREVVTRTYSEPGEYRLDSPAALPAGDTATVEVHIDRTFSAPPDTRDLGMVLMALGFAQ